MADTFRVGDWIVEPQLNSISAGGDTIRLEPKIMQVLVCLAEHANEVVSKERLIQSVWTDTFVSDDVLTRSISELRRVFGDDPKDSRFIQTIPKSGYRLIAPVTLGSAENESVSHEIDERKALPSIKPRARFRKAKVIAACLVVVAMAGASFYVWKITRASASGKSNSIRSIAVLPFKSVGPEVGDEYLGMEMADTLITRLSSTKRLVVCPPGVVRRYNDKNQDPIAAGRELGMDLVLDGSTQKESDRVRFTVRLFNVADGSAVFAERYDEKFADIFVVQDSVAEKVVRSLSLSLTGDERRLLRKHPTDSSDAYKLYMLGRYFKQKDDDEQSMKKAIEYFNDALKKDPNYAIAYSGLADCYNNSGMYGYVLPMEGYLKSKEAVEKALAIDPSLAEAHLSLAFIKYWAEYDWVGAETEYNRMLELDPNIYPSCAAFYWFVGKHDQAIALLNRTLEFDPTDIGANANLIFAFYVARKYDDAIDQARVTLSMEPNALSAHCFAALAYEQRGLYDTAISEIEKATPVNPVNESIRIASLGHMYAMCGKTDKAKQIIDDLVGRSRDRYIHPYLIALVYSGLGNKDKAFEYLEKGYNDRSFFMTYLKVDPRIDSLRSDPRFADLLRRVGLG